jgi:xanthine dehydrogenase accessory factor
LILLAHVRNNSFRGGSVETKPVVFPDFGEFSHALPVKNPRAGEGLMVRAAPEFPMPFHELIRRLHAGERVALCTLVRARGSTPQHTGARMLVTQAGDILGTLGGGCVEAEVRRRAFELLLAGRSQLLTFRLDHDYGWDDGLICGGTMDVYVHSLLAPSDAAPFESLAAAVAARQPAPLRFTYTTDTGETRTYTETLEPAPRLIIAGAGHVGHALAALADPLGFETTIIDDRPDFTTPERFPRATLLTGDIETELARFPIDPFTYIVIVTRGHKNDGRALAAVIRSSAKYLGLIGSKRKIITIFRDLAAQGVPRERLAAVHAPIGLDIGAVSPAEIALSIAAELVATHRGLTPPNTLRLPPHLLDAAFLP